MRRRAFLTALTAGTAGLAGCSFRWGPENDDPAETARPNGTERPGRTRTSGDPGADPTPGQIDPPEPIPEPGARVVEATAGPRTLALQTTTVYHADRSTVYHADRFSLEFGFLPSDDDSPVQMVGVLENIRDHEVVLYVDELPILRSPVLTQEPRTRGAILLLPPTDPNDLAQFVPDVERGPKGYWQLAETDGEGDLYPSRVRLDPGERRRVDCAVLGPPESEGRPVGVYGDGASDRSLAITVWHSDRPGPTDSSRFSGRSVPSPYPGSSVEVAWYHEAGPETSVYVAPSVERASVPARIRFAAINHSDETRECGHWDLYKLVDGTFYGLDSTFETDDCRVLHPGQRTVYELQAFGTDPLPSDDPQEHVFGHLGGGTYAAIAGYGAETTSSGALIDLDAPSTEVAPTDDVIAERDGSSVSVRRTGRDADDFDAVTAALIPIDAADTELIAEQVMQPWNRAIRNTLPYFGEGIEQVVLETSPFVVHRATRLGDPRRFSFRGEAYELVAERSSED